MSYFIDIRVSQADAAMVSFQFGLFSCFISRPPLLELFIEIVRSVLT